MPTYIVKREEPEDNYTWVDSNIWEYLSAGALKYYLLWLGLEQSGEDMSLVPVFDDISVASASRYRKELKEKGFLCKGASRWYLGNTYRSAEQARIEADD